MVAVPLPADGPERLIYLRALRAYSNDCLPPELTPGCPFYRMTEDGPRCSEECMDLLAEHGPDGESPSELVLDLGDGYVAIRQQSRRPRGRRSQDTSGLATDIGRTRRIDAERPVDQRQTTSLVSELREQLITPPWLQPDPREREWAIEAARQELRRRGLDVEGLIRFVLGPQIGFSFLVWLQIAAASETVDDDVPADPAWLALLERTVGVPVKDAISSPKVSRFISGTLRWAAAAPLNEIVGWSAPTVFPSAPPVRDRARANRAHWTLNRFTDTYFSDWATSSLHMEWLYQYGGLPGLCPSAVMHDRSIDKDELAHELAKRSTKQWQTSGGPEGGQQRRIRTEDFTSVAVENIRARRLDVAAGIFEGWTRVDPKDPTGHNNYGFCLLPTHPAAAYEALRQAETLGFQPAILNAADRVLALHLLGLDDEARELARKALAEGHPHTDGYLWEHTDDAELVLKQNRDVHSYLEDLLRPLDEKAGPAREDSR
jgi:hypothetical protein